MPPRVDYTYPDWADDPANPDADRIRSFTDELLGSSQIERPETMTASQGQLLLGNYERRLAQIRTSIRQTLDQAARPENAVSNSIDAFNAINRALGQLTSDEIDIQKAMFDIERRTNPAVAAQTFRRVRENPDDPTSNVIGLQGPTGTFIRTTADPNQVETTNRTRQQALDAAATLKAKQDWEEEQARLNRADNVEERDVKVYLANLVRNTEQEKLASAAELNRINAALKSQDITQQEANSQRQFVAATMKDSTDRLALAIGSINQQDRSAIDVAWAKSVGISYDTWKELSTHIREANKRDFEESVTAYAGEEKQRAGDMKIAMDLAKSKVDAYEAATKGMVRGTNDYWAAFEKGLEFIAAGRPLPKDLFAGLAAPYRVQVDPDMMRREFANIMGTTFENPLPARTKFSEYQRANQGPPKQPNYATPPSPTLTPSQTLAITGIGFDLNAALANEEQTPTQAVAEAGGDEPLTEDFFFDDEGNVTGEPRQIEQPDSELLQLPGDVQDPTTTLLDEQLYPDREDEDTSGDVLVRAASMPSEEDYYMPDPENDMIVEMGPDILSSVVGYAEAEGGPEYIGRIGHAISEVARGLSPQEAVENSFAGTPREWIDYEDSSFFEEEPWDEEPAFTLDIEDYYQEPVYADFTGWEDYEYGA